MTESKIELTERLRREGRWEEASRFKDEVRRECRAKGLKRAEASQAAWEAVETAFPPADAVAGTIPGATSGHDAIDDDLVDLAGGQPFDFARDVQWVYQHLGADVRPQDAPTAGAWGLLTWARRNLSRFFETVLPKASKVEGVDEEQEPCRMAKKSIAEIRAIITRMGGANAVGGTSGGE